MSKHLDWIYDIETYPNTFTVCFADVQARQIKVFEISDRKDQRQQLFEYLRNIYRVKGRLVGFNNEGFDYPVLHKLLKNQNMTVSDIYEFAMSVIKCEDKFAHVIRQKDRIIPQVDLYKIHHFDNQARATSLKMIEYNSRSDNIEDLPFPVGKVLTSDEIDILIKYNIHDVKETFKFYEASSQQMEFRDTLTQQYGLDMTNFNDTKIGKQYFTMELEKNGVKCYEGGKIRQTKRYFIDLAECIFPYVKFERPEFNAILDWLKRQRITETKGVFSNILECDLGDVAKYAKMVTKRNKLDDKPTEDDIANFKKENPLCWVEEVELKSKLPKKDGGGFKKAYYLCWNVAESLNVVINGLCYIFGTGGIHASVESSVIESDQNFIIVDEDVK